MPSAAIALRWQPLAKRVTSHLPIPTGGCAAANPARAWVARPPGRGGRGDAAVPGMFGGKQACSCYSWKVAHATVCVMTGPVEEGVDVAFMREALAQAVLAEAAGEVPVGAVVVADGVVIGRGFNRPIGSKDPTAHAEILALREAAQAVSNYRLTGVRLYVTVEPCLMCVGAIVHARVGTLIYGVPEPKAGAVSSAIPALNHPALNHRVEVIEGILAAECREVLQRFFQARRASFPSGVRQ
jgi:tRNA(adenine34) deaminase